jgi:hypothetical protein
VLICPKKPVIDPFEIVIDEFWLALPAQPIDGPKETLKGEKGLSGTILFPASATQEITIIDDRRNRGLEPRRHEKQQRQRDRKTSPHKNILVFNYCY